MDFLYRKARYQGSAYTVSQLPPDSGVEVAFAGRSNVGKSSVINAITGVKGLARVSKTPGRTRMINFFTLDAQRCLVDLPGYGYAKVPEPVKLQWRQTLSNYLERRQSLCGIVLAMDIRHLLRPFETQMLAWCDAASVPSCVLLTKSDKLKRAAAHRALQTVATHVRRYSPSPRVQLFSARDRSGVEEARTQLDAWLDCDKEKRP